jgi:glycosyltransferase involved in cell wall biosynthesis
MGPTRTTILQIIPTLDTGGAELSTIEIAAAVVQAGGRAIVLSEGGRMASNLSAAGGEFIAFPAASKNPLQMIKNAAAIAAIARKEGAHLIHARSRAPAWSAFIAARHTKLPFVTTYHGIYTEKSRAKNLYNSVMARGDIVIANSRYTADLIKSRYRTPAERIYIIYRGVDLAAFDPSAVTPERVNKLKSRWGVADDQRLVLHTARLTRWKGQSDVIAAAARIRDLGRDCVFILAGDQQRRDDYRDGLLRQIEREGLAQNVRLVGHVDDMPAAFAAAHAAIVASIKPEAFGRAAAEAQAMGCPVISTDIGASPETILTPPRVAPAARTGWLVPPGDLAAYEAALVEALSLDDEARSDMGRRARAHVAAEFSTFDMQRATLAAYDQLLKTEMQARFVNSALAASGKDRCEQGR